MAESLTTFKQKFDNQLTCGVCLGQYTDPKTLPCLHSFCLECVRRIPLDKKGDKYSLKCPTCRIEHPLAQRGADEFPNAFQINSLLELRNDLAKKESPSIGSNNNQQKQGLGDNAGICPLHNDPLRVYCKTCNRLICRDCTVTNEHKKHKHTLIVECYPEHCQQIEGELKHVKEKITNIDTAIINLASEVEEIEEQRGRITIEIHQHAQQLIDIIHESERQLIQQVDTITQHKKDFLAKQKEAAGRVHSQLKTCEELIERNLKEMSQEKLIMETQHTIAHIKKASKHIDPAVFAPIERANVKYKKNSNFDCQQTIGEIEGSTCAKAVVDAPSHSFPQGKKCSLTLALESHDGSPFPVPCSAISCVAHCSTGVMQTVKSNISKSRSVEGKYNISFVSQSNQTYKLEALVGGAGIPGNSIFCAVTPVKSINLECVPHYCIAVCDNGQILATEQNTHCITVLDTEGRKVRSIGTDQGTKEGQFMHPHGLAVTNDGHILVTDRHRLQKLTLDGVCVKSVGSSENGRGPLKFDYPSGIAVHPTTGQIFVAERYNNHIQVLNADLTFSHIITPQDDPQLQLPTDVSLDSEGYLYVAEYGNHCITKLTTTGQYMRFGSSGSAHGCLSFPTSLTIHNNLVYVSEYGNNRVSVFDTKGRFINCIGEGELKSPYGVAVDKLCNLYVSDQFRKKIIIY